VLAAAKELARVQRTSAGAVVSQLLRQALSGAEPSRVGAPKRATGFDPFPARGRVVTPAQVDALRDAEGV
jgi:hypothetical protein